MKKLLKVALILSLLGIFLLLLLSQTLKQPLININQAKNLGEYEKVRIQAEIISLIEASPNFFILKVKDSSNTISITLNSKKNLVKQKSFSKGNLIQILGKINFYKNDSQISADKIVLVKNVT